VYDIYQVSQACQMAHRADVCPQGGIQKCHVLFIKKGLMQVRQSQVHTAPSLCRAMPCSDCCRSSTIPLSFVLSGRRARHVRHVLQAVAQPRGKPIIVFNGELDRLRGGYYPSLFFPELARLTNEFLPKFETAYYIHSEGPEISAPGASVPYVLHQIRYKSSWPGATVHLVWVNKARSFGWLACVNVHLCVQRMCMNSAQASGRAVPVASHCRACL